MLLNIDSNKMSEKQIDNLLNASIVSDDAFENYRKIILNSQDYRLSDNKNYKIKDIFKDYWDDFYNLYKDKIRLSVKKNVEKIIDCGNFNNGYLYYECPNCDNYHKVAFTCKSRFCPSCNKKYSNSRSIEIANKCINVSHRHIVFTIPDTIRKYFAEDRTLLNVFFKSVELTFEYIATSSSKISKKRQDTFGYVSTLHTYGRDIKWNPHIHVLIAEVKMDKFQNIKKFEYFNYNLLKKTFMNVLTKLMKKHIKTKDFNFVVSKLYKKYNNGFYVYAPKIQMKSFSENSLENLISYVTRYTGHPAISESRITNINYETDEITWFYDPHEDDLLSEDDDKFQGTQYVTENVFSFIKKLIRHIPDEYVNYVRYYGFYANKYKNKDVQLKKKLFSLSKINKMKKSLKWPLLLEESFNYKILKCHCGSTMTINYDYCLYPSKGS